MRASFIVLLSLLFVCSCQEPPVESYAVIPQPAEIAYTPGFVKLKQQPVVAYSPALANEAQMLQSYLQIETTAGRGLFACVGQRGTDASILFADRFFA